MPPPKTIIIIFFQISALQPLLFYNTFNNLLLLIKYNQHTLIVIKELMMHNTQFVILREYLLNYNQQSQKAHYSLNSN